MSEMPYRENAYVEPKPPTWWDTHGADALGYGFVGLFLAICFATLGHCIWEDYKAAPERARVAAEKKAADDAHNFYCGGFGRVPMKDLPAECVAYWSKP